jgi:CRP-like cAMP-binding protein
MKQPFIFSPTVQSALLAKATLRTELKGTVLFRRGDPSFGVFLLRKGSVGLQLESRGKAILDRTVTPGAVIGLPATLSGDHYSLTASTLEKSELAFVGCQDLLELMNSSPSVGVEVVHALGEEVVQMREILAATPNGHPKGTSKSRPVESTPLRH